MNTKRIASFVLSAIIVLTCLVPAIALAKVYVPPVSAPACGNCGAVYYKDKNGNEVCNHKPGCPSGKQSNN